MRPILLLPLLALAGCITVNASEALSSEVPFSVKLNGTCVSWQTKRERAFTHVESGLYEGMVGVGVRDLLRPELRPLPDAKVSVRLTFRKQKKDPRPTEVAEVLSSGTFAFTADGVSDEGPLSGVIVRVDAPGHLPVVKIFEPNGLNYHGDITALLEVEPPKAEGETPAK